MLWEWFVAFLAIIGAATIALVVCFIVTFYYDLWVERNSWK